MILTWFYDLMPFTVKTTLFRISPFVDIEVGECFQEGEDVYRLLDREPFQVKVVKMNRWTRFWWGGPINGSRQS